MAPEKTQVVWGILLAGGLGFRFSKAGDSKLLWMLGNDLYEEPVILWSARAILAHPAVERLVVVTHPEYEVAYQTTLAPLFALMNKPVFWTHGGVTRQESVYKGLQQIINQDTRVLIHDAARPLVQSNRIDALLDALDEPNVTGASLGLPMYDSLKSVHVHDNKTYVSESADRASYWRVHTPQAFYAPPLIEAHERLRAERPDSFVNDDLAAIEEVFGKSDQHLLRMVEDDAFNIKLTTEGDGLLAQGFARRLTTSGVTVSTPTG